MNPPDQPTPRTDAAIVLLCDLHGVEIDFARTLERELAETERLRFGADADRRRLRAEVERLRECVSTPAGLRLQCGRLFPHYEWHDSEFIARLRTLAARAEKAEAELANIANAKPHTWGDMSDSFQAWAQSRARHALAAMKGTI
jgi:hypothetical protein